MIRKETLVHFLLSRAFAGISHHLLLAKLNGYGFTLPALTLVQCYLSNRKQRTKINSEFSSWEEILLRVSRFYFFLDHRLKTLNKKEYNLTHVVLVVILQTFIKNTHGLA